MSEPKQINLLDDPRVWTGPASPRTDQRLPSFEQPYEKAECVYRPDPFNNVPNPVIPWADEYPSKVLPNSPKVNLTPGQQKDMMAAVRYDEGKTNWSLMPFEAVEEVNKVLEFGAKKYAPDNWKKGFPISRVLNSCLRHLFAYMKGEQNDPESGLSHIAHASCNLLFILYFTKYKEKYSKFLPDEKNT